MGIEVLGPCVNHSGVKFQPETLSNGRLAVRFGLAAVKSMSAETVRGIVEEREKNGPYKSLEDLCYRIPSQSLRRNQIEVLVQCGAFDWMHCARAQIFEDIERCMGGAAVMHRDNEAGQMALFNVLDTAPVKNKAQDTMREWPKERRLEDEKNLTGFYFTGNPLDSMRGIIDKPGIVSIGSLSELSREELRTVKDMAGMIRNVVIRTSKNSGQRFAVITVEDFTGITECLVWGDAYSKANAVEGLLQEGNFVRFRAKITDDERSGGKRVSVNSIELISSSRRARDTRKTQHFELSLLTTRHDAGDLAKIREVLMQYPGSVPVQITIRNSLGNTVRLELGKEFSVELSPELETALSMYS